MARTENAEQHEVERDALDRAEQVLRQAVNGLPVDPAQVRDALERVERARNGCTLYDEEE